MSVALDSSLHHDIHEDPTSESVADFLLEGAEHSPNAAGSFQVPDSDNDESLEELAGQQEQEYWSILGVDDPLLPVQLISPHASVKETPPVTSRRARSRSPLVIDPDSSPSRSESPLPSLSSLARPKSQARDSAQNGTHIIASPLARWSPSMSPDPLLLHNGNLTATHALRRAKPTRVNGFADEGYQTKTDSDHVTSLGDASVEPEDEPQQQQAELAQLTRSPNSPSSSLGDLPRPLTVANPQTSRKIDFRFLSSPLSSPTASPEPCPTAIHQQAGVVGVSAIARSPAPLQAAPRQDVLASEDALEAPLSENGAAPARQFRQRKAIQLAPYSTEFTKFASIANKNDWQGIITAGLKQAFSEEERAKAEFQKRQRTATDEWLVHEDEAEEEQESDFSEPVSEPTSTGRRRRSTPVLPDPNGRKEVSRSIEKYSRSRTEKDWDPVANRWKAATKPAKPMRTVKDNHERTGSAYASSSRTTIEDLERSAARRLQHKRAKVSVPSHRSAGGKATVSATHDTAARTAQITQAREAGLLPSDVDSSSSEQHRSARKKQAGSKRASSPRSLRPGSTTKATVIESSSVSGSDSEGAPGSDSPDRPIATHKDRFTLKGKRKRAAMFMMPAVAFKKAEADLRLMEREMDEGKQIRLEELDGDTPDSTADASAKAKKRWRPQNADRPFRYVTELSTSDSESESDNGRTSISNGDDETQAAMQAWTVLANGKAQTSTEPRNEDGAFWDNVIGRILVRKEQGRPEPSRRRRKPKSTRQENSNRRRTKDPNAKGQIRSLPRKQSALTEHFVSPVYLDTAERLFDNIRAGPAALRAPARIGRNRDAFWNSLTGITTDSQLGEEARATPNATAPATKHQSTKFIDKGLTDTGDEPSKFARFSFDYDINRLPAGLRFSVSSYLGCGNLQELICYIKKEPNFNPRTPITPFGIGLDSTMESTVLLQMLPRLLDCMYEHAVGENVSYTLNSPLGQALRFLGYYVLVYNSRDSSSSVVRATVFEQLANLEARLERYIEEVDAVDRTLISSLVAVKWATLEMTILGYAEKQANAGFSAKQTARHHILEDLKGLARLLLQAGHASPTKELFRAQRRLDRRDTDVHLEEIYCETWVCLINLCFVCQSVQGYDFLSLASLWQTVEHCLNEEAIERQLHPIVRGETASLAAMSLCALSQFDATGVSGPAPQLVAHWPLVAQILDNISVADFAAAYQSMSSANRTRTSRYIWTIFARCLNMSSRWGWPMLDQGKIIGRLFDILNSRQLEDFCIDGQADFPLFLSNFSGHIPTQIDRDDTAFHIFLRILAQAAQESHESNDKKSKLALARIAMRIMPMREHLPYPRHSSAEKAVDPSILVNHCALFVVLAIIDPSTSDRRFAKLKTILDFVSSDTRARQDYLKAIMFMGIVYKVRGINLSPVLSWLTHTADYLCQTYTLCAKRRATLLSSRRKLASMKKNAQHQVNKPGVRQGSAPVSGADYERELHAVNKEMGETAVMEGLLLGAVQHIMLTASEKTGATDNYPCLAYLDTSWTVQVLASPMARDPVAGMQVLQCLRKFVSLRNACMQKLQPSLQSESQDEFGDMDFDYDDPSLNAMLGLPEHQAGSSEVSEKEPDPRHLDTRFVEMLKTDICPRLYSILSDLNATSSGQESGVPEFPNRKQYIANVVETWALCAVVLVQKGQREWHHFMDPFGKESWQRFADISGRFEAGGVFACTMLANDSKAYKITRNIVLEILFRRLASPSLSHHDAQLFTRLLNADAEFVLWQGLPFEVDELVNGFDIQLADLTKSRLAVLRAIFSNCKHILTRDIITLRGIERSSAAVCREQLVDDRLVYLLLGYMLSSLRDFLDASRTLNVPLVSQKEYAAYCRQVIFLMKEEMGPSFVTEHNIPPLRLLAGVINGTVS